MKIRLARFALLGLGAVVLSSCSAANSITQTLGRMASAAGRTVR